MNASTDGRIGPAVPVLRIFDVPRAVEFYCDYLGFTLDGEHRFEPDAFDAERHPGQRQHSTELTTTDDANSG